LQKLREEKEGRRAGCIDGRAIKEGRDGGRGKYYYYL
jgi:hypothetical protein